MPNPAHFGFEQLVTELLRGLTEAIGDRPGETDMQRFARHQTAIFSAMAFMPRDSAETMLAGQCVMLDSHMRQCARELALGEDAVANLRARAQFIAMGRLFLRTLAQLRLLQARPLEQIAVVPQAEVDPRPNAAPKLGRSLCRPVSSRQPPPPRRHRKPRKPARRRKFPSRVSRTGVCDGRCGSRTLKGPRDRDARAARDKLIVERGNRAPEPNVLHQRDSRAEARR